MIAIDPGQSGGIAFLSQQGDAGAFKMPDTDREISDVLCPDLRPSLTSTRFPLLMGETVQRPRVVYLESIVKFAGTNMPGSSGIVYGDSCGFVRGVLTAFDYRIVLAPPKTWQKALGLGSRNSHPSRTAWKNHLKNRAQQLFPNVKVTLNTADALLILEAARRGLLG
jgi:hypothetical protein